MDNRRRDPEEGNEACDDVCLCPPWGSKRAADEGNLRPIEGNEAHSETGLVTEELVDDNVVRNNPAHPGEVAERLEKIAWDEVPTKATEPDVYEESATRESATVAYTSINSSVQSVEERAGNQVHRPD